MPSTTQPLTSLVKSSQDFNHCHAEYFNVLHWSPIFILLTGNIPVSIRVKNSVDPDQMALSEDN